MMQQITLKKSGDLWRSLGMWLLGIRSNYHCAQTWDELTRKQLLKVVREMFAEQNTYITRIKLAHIISRIPLIAHEFLSDEDKVALAQQADWIIEKPPALTKQLIGKWDSLYGPSDDFDNLTVGEFLYADKLFSAYLRTKNTKALDAMVAVLYRKKNRNAQEVNEAADARQPFNSNTIEARINKVRFWRKEIKLAVFVWYYGCRQHFVDQNKELFSGTGEAHPLGMYSIVSDLSPKFGTIGDTMKVKLKTFALEWKKAAHDADKARKK